MISPARLQSLLVAIFLLLTLQPFSIIIPTNEDLISLASAHSVTPFNSSSCGDVLCIHGRCIDGHCVCQQGWGGSACHRCGGRTSLTARSGHITDGMGNYSTDLQCTWLIDSGFANESIRLEFSDFETECGWDHLYIFDGDSIFSPLIGAFSGQLLRDRALAVSKGKSLTSSSIAPLFPEIIARSGRAYLYFYSDAAFNMSGFNLSYSMGICPGNCSGRGTCETHNGRCVCEPGWRGEACEQSECPNDCSAHGNCDTKDSPYKCVCDTGWAGVDCSQREQDGVWLLVDPLQTEEEEESRRHHQNNNNNNFGKKIARAMSATVLVGDSFYVLGGQFLHHNHQQSHQGSAEYFLAKFNLLLRKWEILNGGADELTGDLPAARFAHTALPFADRIYMYGGILQNGSITNEFWTLELKSLTWSRNEEHVGDIATCFVAYCAPIATAGHTATLIDERMVVIFGYNPVYGYLNTVQEYSFVTRKWNLVQTRGAVVKGGFGHTAVYDSGSKMIYLFGGYHSHSSDAVLVDSLYAYHPGHKSWMILNPSRSPRYLHSAVILNGLMLVYGGNSHNATSEPGDGDKCFSSTFMAYEISCDRWKVLSYSNVEYITSSSPSTSLTTSDLTTSSDSEENFSSAASIITKRALTTSSAGDLGRLGHSAFVYNGAMYIFGGFSGIMLDSILKFTPGDCGRIKTQEKCVKYKPGVRCVWNVEKSACLPFSHSAAQKSPSNGNGNGQASSSIFAPCEPNLPAQSSELCFLQNNCLSCLENSFGCIWCGEYCSHQKCRKSGGSGSGSLPSSVNPGTNQVPAHENGSLPIALPLNTFNMKGITDSSRCHDQTSSACDKLHNCHACHSDISCHWHRDSKCFPHSASVAHPPHKGISSATAGKENSAHASGINNTTVSTGIGKSDKPYATGLHADYRQTCDVPCHLRSSCENCTQGQCMWCSSTRQCIESNAYAAMFPTGQCMEWTIHPWKCTSLNCADIITCDRCLRNPRCGWCDDGTGTGVGICLDGSASGPRVWNKTSYIHMPAACPARDWHFTRCPECQCNGHSYCVRGITDLNGNGDATGGNDHMLGSGSVDDIYEPAVCQKPCKHLTEGSHCQQCVAGHFGNPVNGGNCTPCSCHGHSQVCHRETGKCHCSTKGIIGHNCDRCDETNHYFGDPMRDGGSCYYNLTIDFQYTFNMSKQDDRYFNRINFMNLPLKSDVDVDLSVTCSEHAFVNISIGPGISSDNLPTKVLHERLSCGAFKLRFNNDEHLFGVENTTFFVNVFAFATPFVIQVSFSQHRTLDLLQFFVTFSSCFLTLLIIAAILWKIKQKYDMYRRRQQLFVEMEQMASRPFAGVNLELDPFSSSASSALLGYKSAHDEAETHHRLMNSGRQIPCPVALEPLSRARAAVMTVLIKLPGNPTPPGQSGLALGSCLISLSSNMEEDLRKGYTQQETSFSNTNLQNKMTDNISGDHNSGAGAGPAASSNGAMANGGGGSSSASNHHHNGDISATPPPAHPLQPPTAPSLPPQPPPPDSSPPVSVNDGVRLRGVHV